MFQAILSEVPKLQHIIVVDNTPTTWPTYSASINIHNMAAVQKLGARQENSKWCDHVYVCACTFSPQERKQWRYSVCFQVKTEFW